MFSGISFEVPVLLYIKPLSLSDSGLSYYVRDLLRLSLSECSVKCHKYKPYTDKHSTKSQNPQAYTAYTVGVDVEEKVGINERACAEVVGY